MQRLSQYDNRWKNTKFGTPGSPLTIAGYGCTITSLANHSDNFTPLDVADFCDFVPDANLIWESISKIPGFSFNLADRIWAGDIGAIRQRIDNGMKGMIEIQQGTNRPMHWLAVLSYSEGGFVCVDPLNPLTDTIIPNNRITGGCFFTVQNSNNSDNNDIMLKNNLKQQIDNHPFDADTRKALLIAVDNDDMGYIIAHSGANPRLEWDKWKDKAETLQKQIDDTPAKDCTVEVETAVEIAESNMKVSIDNLSKLVEAERTKNVALEIAKNIEIANLQKEKDSKKPEGLPIWQRSIFDAFRNGTYGAGGAVAFFGVLEAAGVTNLFGDFLVEGNFSQNSLATLVLSGGMLLLGYMQELQKNQRKQNETLDLSKNN